MFHSFGEFGVPNNNIANFLNETGVATSNILGRVTGGNMSNIFGTIQTRSFVSANLFLLNPAGFLFGPTAVVHVGGMVAFTSADYLRLEELDISNAGIFHADPARANVLTNAPVAAFGFLGSNPGAITVQGSEFSGQSISLVGGNISIESGTPEGGTARSAQLLAPNGKILLASTRSPGEFDATSLQTFSPNVDGTTFASSGSVLLAKNSIVDVSGRGTVSIRGGQFVLEVANSLLNTSENSSSGVDNIVLNKGTAITTATTGPGNAGDVFVKTDNLIMNGGATITAQSTGSGNAGNVTIQGLASPADSVVISGFDENFNSSGIFTDTQGTGAGGNIFVNANSIALSNAGTLSAATTGPGNAGNISIHADTLSLDGFSQIQANTRIDSQGRGGNIDVQVRAASLAGGSGILTNTVGLGDAGDIRIQAAQSIALTGASFITSSSFDSGNGAGNAGLIHLTAPTINLQGGYIISLSQGPGNAGNIILEANTVTASDQSFMSSETLGPGRGGNISIQGLNGSGSRAGDVTISGQTTITSVTSGEGRAGDIAVLTERMTLTNSLMNTSTAATGDAGNITINASELVQVSSVSALQSRSGVGPTGNAGQITITTPTITVDQGGVISTSTSGTGNAGSITVNANSVNLLSGGQLTSSSSVDPAPNAPLPTGSAGTVTVTGLAVPANSVFIDGASSGIFTDTQGTGAGGDLNILANTVTLQNGGALSAKTSGTASSASGGTITVDATNTLTINSGATITANSAGAADAGSINITATNGLTMQQNSSITTEVTPSDTGSSAGGGNIKITTSPEATVWLQNSTISASVADGPGGGGNISIDPQFVILQHSQILAQAAQGQGGAITITTNLFLPDANSIVSADSGSGLNGTVTIQSPNAPASGKIQPLGKTPLQATSLLNQPCAALAGGEFSSFTVAGRDSLPAEPGGWLASPLALAITETGNSTMTEAINRTPVSEPAGETPLLSLRQIAPPGFLTQAFAADSSAGCRS